MGSVGTVSIVPLLTLVVLSYLLVSLSRCARSIAWGAAGVWGVTLGGPAAIVVLGFGSQSSCADFVLATENPVQVVRGAASEQEEPEQTPLSIEAERQRVVFPEDWPAWIDAPPKQLNGSTAVLVDSGPHERRSDCEKQFDLALREAAQKFINEHLESPYASQFLRLDLQQVEERLVDSDYVYQGTIDSPSVGPMHVKYALVGFHQEFCDELEVAWRRVLSTSRLAQAVLVGASVLALLAVLFGYLRLDTATRGFYTGRLQFVALAAILTLIAAGVVAATLIPWM